MENNHFGKLTERMHNFREELLNAKPYVCAERAVLTTESYRMHADKPGGSQKSLYAPEYFGTYDNLH